MEFLILSFICLPFYILFIKEENKLLKQTYKIGDSYIMSHTDGFAYKWVATKSIDQSGHFCWERKKHIHF